MVLSGRPTLYERLGDETLEAVVYTFYHKVMADKRIRHFFLGVDILKLVEHQRSFIAYAINGPNKYSGRSLREAHKDLVEKRGLKEEHFDAATESLVAALQEHRVMPDIIADIMEIVAKTRDEVLNR